MSGYHGNPITMETPTAVSVSSLGGEKEEMVSCDLQVARDTIHELDEVTRLSPHNHLLAMLGNPSIGGNYSRGAPLDPR